MWRWCCRWLPAFAMGDMTKRLVLDSEDCGFGSAGRSLSFGQRPALRNTVTRLRMPRIWLRQSAGIAPWGARVSAYGGAQ